MKKFLLLVLSVVALVCTLAFGASAYDGTQYGSTGIYYTVSGGKVTITDASSSITTANIPSTINGYSVTSIGKFAFAYCSGLTNITIPDSVTGIGSSAFEYCSGLKKVNITDLKAWCEIKFDSYYSNPLCYAHNLYLNNKLITDLVIPNSVTSIGNYAFEDCSSLTSITIPNSVTSIGDDAFEDCSSLTSITIPNSVTSIGYGAFRRCTGLTSITIPNSVKSIDSYAFFDCTGLTSITIPNSVTSIGDDAFWGCTGLTSITIPNSLTSIGNYAFSGCSGLTSIKVDKYNTVYDSRDNCNAIIEKATNKLIVGCKNTIIPKSVTSIGNNAFSERSGLTSITIPNSVTSIGSGAFYNCSALTSITIPDSVTSISSSAFSECSGLTSIKVDKYNTVYDSRDNCNAIIEKATNKLIAGCKNTIIPNSVTSIGYDAFRGCTGLTSITIPNSVKSIDSYTFYYCSGLTSITIGNSVTSIGSYAFYECSKLTSITIPNSVTSIGRYAFYKCSKLTSITIPNSVTSIDSYAFFYCSGLTSITIGNSVTSIGSSAFEYCSGLTKVNITDIKAWCGIEFYSSYSNPLYYAHNLYLSNKLITDLVIPNSVTSMGYSAFYGCSGLTSITIPNSVTSIGDDAFWGCTGLTSITIPNSLTSIGNYAFSGCSGLTSIKVDKYNTVYDSRDNCNAIIEKATNKLIVGCKNTIIPNSVTSIGSWAFYNCSALTSITIPDSVTSIDSFAFSGCSGLTSIKVDKYNTVYDSRDNCNAIIEKASNKLIVGCKNTIIPNSVTNIGSYAFYKCSGLTSITIPNSVTTIVSSAFYDCSGLTSMTIGNKNCEISGMPSSVTIRCPHDSKALDYAKRYGNKYELTDSHTLVVLSKVSATCTTNGKTEGKKCSSCGEIIEVQKSIPAFGHAYKDVVKTKAAFGKNGKIESTCQYCGDVRSSKTIKAIEGIYQDGYVSYDESISGGVYNYTGKAIKPDIEVYDTAGKIIPSKYYTVSYSNNVDIGTGIITVKFKGNYTGTAEEYFDIYCSHIYKKSVTKATLTKDGKTVKTCANCGKKSTTVIPKIKTVALSATTYTCNNSERKPSVTVKDTKGKVLKKGTDYSVSYSSGRIKPGTYTVTVTFKGNYSGSKKLSYKIGLAKVTGLKQTSGKGLCLAWNKVPGATGYIIQQYISSEKKYKDVKTVSTNSYKKSSASGVKAQIRIIATYGSIKSSPSSAISAKSK